MENGSGKEHLRRLAEAARLGDATALESLLSSFMQPVYRFGLKMCRDGEDAKDVLQETMLAAAKSVSGFRGDSEVGTWLFTIARRACLRRRRRKKGEPATAMSLEHVAQGDAPALVDGGRLPEEHAHRREIAQALEQALAQLAPAYREVLLLRDVEGLTAPEVASALGIGLEAVKSRLHRARLAMRAPVLEPPRGQGPSCQRALTVLSRRLEGEVEADACARMERHVAACPSCKAACESLRSTLALCRGYGAEPVPREVQERVKAALHAAAKEMGDAGQL